MYIFIFSNLLSVEGHAPEVQAMATFSKTLPRLTRPAAVTAPSQTVMPTISITKVTQRQPTVAITTVSLQYYAAVD